MAPALWGWLRLEQGELVEGEAAAACGPLPLSSWAHRISTTHGSHGAGSWKLPRDPAYAGGLPDERGPSLRAGHDRAGQRAQVSHTAQQCVECDCAWHRTGLTQPPFGWWAESQPGGWTGGLSWLRLRAWSPRGLPWPLACLFGLSALLLQRGFRQTERSFWVRICLFNIDKTLLH